MSRKISRETEMELEVKMVGRCGGKYRWNMGREENR